MNKTEDEAYALLEELANDECQWAGDRRTLKRHNGKHEVDAITALTAQMETLTKQLQATQMGVHSIQASLQVCELCGGSHSSESCQVGNPFGQTQVEQAQYVGNFGRPQNNPYSQTYNPGWRNHPNFSWKNNQNMGNVQ